MLIVVEMVIMLNWYDVLIIIMIDDDVDEARQRPSLQRGRNVSDGREVNNIDDDDERSEKEETTNTNNYC